MVSREVASFLIVTSIVSLGILLRKISKPRVASSINARDPSSLVHQRLIESVESCAETSRSKISAFGKIELHCHLNGSVRMETLREILGSWDGPTVVHSINDAFDVFKKVYEAVNSQSVLRRIVRELLTDAVADNVRYLELRTTPRKLSDVSSHKEYVKIVVDEISRFPGLNRQKPLASFPNGKIAVRLILTINRSEPIALAEQTIDIALRFPGLVVGIDFAGNPSKGTFEDFIPAFERARGHGLFTTVHTSEIRGVDKETDAILDFKPNRMGHFLFPTEEQIQKALHRGISIESCPTSNMCAINGVAPVDGRIEGHGIIERFVRHQPGVISINTDDPRVFGVNLSDELFTVANSFNLSAKEISVLIMNSAQQAFLSKPEREALLESLVKIFYR